MIRLTSVLVVIMAISISCNSQSVKDSTVTKDFSFLVGLTKATEEDLGEGTELTLDGETIPVYNVDGKRIREMELMEAFFSGEYSPEFYIDTNKDVKAICLRLTTDVEKEKLKNDKLETELKSEEVISFSVKDIDGEVFSSEELKGKIIVVNFWFIACKPCLMEVPELNKLVEKYKEKNIVFLGFASDDKSKLETFLKQKEFKYNIIPNSKEISKDFNITSFPTNIVIDQESKIIFKASGLTPSTISNIEKEIDKLLQE